jgi:hypothetical protein
MGIGVYQESEAEGGEELVEPIEGFPDGRPHLIQQRFCWEQFGPVLNILLLQFLESQTDGNSFHGFLVLCLQELVLFPQFLILDFQLFD